MQAGEITGQAALEELKKPSHDISIFSRCIEEETKSVANVGRTLLKKDEYQKKFKLRDLEIDKHGNI